MTQASSPAGPAARLAAFWRQVAALRRRRAARRGIARALLLAAGPVLVVVLLAPPQWPWAIAALGSAALLGGSLAVLSARGAPAAGWLTGLRGAPRGFADGLVTWTEPGRWHGSALAAWFEAELADGVAKLAAPNLAEVGRRSAWTRRWLRRAGWLTLLALLFGLWLAPPWPGLLGPTPPPPEPPPAAAPESAATSPTGLGPAPVPAGVVELHEPPLDLPSAPQFVVPQFVDDGPSRRETAPVVEVPQAPPTATPAPAGGSGQPAPQSQPERFARAAEAAQRARHVAPDERAIVRRYFERLREAGN